MKIELRLRAAGASERGKEQYRNEDAYRIVHGRGASVCVVADGMGGMANGAVASSLAARIVGERSAAQSGLPAARIRAAVAEANRAILEASRAELHLHGIGSTIALLLLDGMEAHVAHVGDSRVYLLRSGAIRRCTEDHSLSNYVRELPPGGRTLTPEELSSYSSIITRALGVAEEVEVEQASLEARPGDAFLLCTDGLTDALDDPRIAAIVEEAGDDLESACGALIQAALEEAGKSRAGRYICGDDVTAIAARVESSRA